MMSEVVRAEWSGAVNIYEYKSLVGKYKREFAPIFRARLAVLRVV